MHRPANPGASHQHAAQPGPELGRKRQPTTVVLAAALLVGMNPGSAAELPQPDIERASFYAPYAAMATEVYRSGSAPDSWFASALSTAWLRREIDVHGTAFNQKRFWTLELGMDRERENYMEQLRANCVKEHGDAPVPAELQNLKAARAKPTFTTFLGQLDTPQRVNCYALKWELKLQAEQGLAALDEVNVYQPGEPKEARDCNWSPGSSSSGRAKPLLDVQTAVDRAGWTLVPELRRVSAVRGWRVFVPELAVDVWQRPRAAIAGQRVYEYAIVFRGTVGGGGWVSNLRALTAGLPIFWDQYAQALDVTRKLVIQIQGMHVLRDNLLEVSTQHPTQLLFTAVGHSLGGGLAHHAFLNVPAITRVVAFDSSPMDGSSLIPVGGSEPEAEMSAAVAAKQAAPSQTRQDRPLNAMPKPSRAEVMQNGARRIDTAFERQTLERNIPGAAVYQLHEHGELLSAFRPCHSGPLWGKEGGPMVACESVNYSTGGPLAQHSMAELACRLDLASKGIKPRSIP